MDGQLASQSMSIHDEISKLENVLRSIVEDVMEVSYEESWVEHLGVSDERIEKWRVRQTEAGKHSTGAVVEKRLLYYSDFPDLLTIIRKNWDRFKPCFGDKKEIEVYLNRLNELRNPTAHSRPVLEHEESLARGICRELRQKVTIFRNTGAGGDEPEHFSRIEGVTDSFGHRAGGRASGEQTVDTRDQMTLRPGDVVAFRGSAVDPNGRPMHWTISSPFRGAGNLVLGEIKSSSFDVEWDVTEEDIHEQLEIDITLKTVVGPHRYGNHDDQVRMIYRVLPCA